MLKGKLTTGGELLGRVSGVMELDPTLITKNITANGTYTAASDNADGYSEVNVDVQPDLITKNITANGTYTAASDNADGYSSVNVNVNVKHPIVTAASHFGYYENVSQYLYIDTYLEEGDTIVFAFTSRSNITLPSGVELIFKGANSWSDAGQYLMFAKYTAANNESHFFEFTQATSWRFYCTYAIFHDVTVIHSGSFLTYYNTRDSSRTSYNVPDKQEGEILFWSYAVEFGPLDSGIASILTTIPNDIFRVSWPVGKYLKYPRLVSFLDIGAGATHRIFTNSIDPVQCNERCVIDALQITPN